MLFHRDVSPQLTVLLTNVWLEGAGGTECVVRDIARGMQARGHRPIVYSPCLGGFAHSIRESGIAVVDDLDAVTERPDIIHGHHFIPTAEAIIRFPDAAALYVCHSWRFWVEQPPSFPQIRLHAGVNKTIVNNLTVQNGIPAEQVVFLPNAVDLQRFAPRQRPWPSASPRLLVFHGGGIHHRFIREAAAQLRLPLTSIGRGGDRMTDTPEDVLLDHDIVFATGRAALEAMACGCAVIVCGEAGMASLVTPENFEWYRNCNFAVGAFTRPISTEALIAEVQACDPVEVAKVSALVREVAPLDRQLDLLEGIYRRIREQATAEPVSAAAHQLALRQFHRAALPRLPHDKRWPWQEERYWMGGEIEKWKANHASASAEHASVSAALASTSKDFARTRSEVEQLKHRLELSLQEHAALSRENAALSRENAALSSELARMWNSRSWRLTGPLREARRILSLA